MAGTNNTTASANEIVQFALNLKTECSEHRDDSDSWDKIYYIKDTRRHINSWLRKQFSDAKNFMQLREDANDYHKVACKDIDAASDGDLISDFYYNYQNGREWKRKYIIYETIAEDINEKKYTMYQFEAIYNSL